jgi:hypothetical protein
MMKVKKQHRNKQIKYQGPFKPYKIRPFLSEELHLAELIMLSEQLFEFATGNYSIE